MLAHLAAPDQVSRPPHLIGLKNPKGPERGRVHRIVSQSVGVFPLLYQDKSIYEVSMRGLKSLRVRNTLPAVCLDNTQNVYIYIHCPVNTLSAQPCLSKYFGRN